MLGLRKRVMFFLLGAGLIALGGLFFGVYQPIVIAVGIFFVFLAFLIWNVTVGGIETGISGYLLGSGVALIAGGAIPLLV